jgi:SAM-dependent methyltransferase
MQTGSFAMKMDEYYAAADDWNADADDYNPDERIRFEKGSRIIRELTANQPGTITVLDAACGSGLLGEYLCDERFELHGLELSDELVAAARGRFRSVQRHDLDRPWPVDDGGVDVVFAGAVLEHIFDYHAFINEANRVLKPGGLFHVQVPNLGCWREIRRLLLRKQPHWMKDIQHVHAWTLSWLTAIFRDHGFEVVDSECDRLVPPLWRNLRCRPLERLLASWGSVLLVTGRKTSRKVVVDRFLSAKFPRHTVRSSRWIEVEAA